MGLWPGVRAKGAGDNKSEVNAMTNPLEEFKDVSYGRWAALGHKLGGLKAIEAVLKDDDLAWRVKKMIIGAKSAVARSFADLLSACKQNWVNDNFNEKNFPLEPVADDESEWEVYEYHFNKTVNGLDAFKKLEELGYRLCGPRRAMEYIANGHLDIQLDHPLIVTASWGDSVGFWCAPLFFRDYGKRDLRLCRLGRGFDPFCGWLVLRKRS